MKQGLNYIIGVVLLLLVASIDLDQLQNCLYLLYIVGFVSLILLKILLVSNFTPEKLGAKRWFVFPLVGQIQPSEFFKISLLVVASIAVKHNAQYMARTFQTDLKLVGKIMLVSLPPMAVVYSQPDTGWCSIRCCHCMYFIYVRYSEEIDSVMYSYSSHHTIHVNIYLRKV